MTPGSLLPGLPAGSRILIIRLRSVGDIVLLTPALQLLKCWRRDLEVSVLLERRFYGLLDHHPDADEILYLGDADGRRTARSQIDAVRRLRRRRFSLCLNLHGGPTSAFLARSSGAQWTVGFHHFRHRRLYDFLIPDARTILHQSVLHTAEHQASALFALGLPRRAVPAARLFPSAAELDWWQTERARLNLGPTQAYALIHPTALYPTKQWAAENFAEVGRFLEGAAIAPVYGSGPGESAALDSVARAAKTSVRRLEGASLGQYAAAIAGARLFLGNDSGPAHMAAALGRPLVVVFGSSSSAIWGPWPRHTVGRTAEVVQNPYPCNPCPGDHCYCFAQPECIRSVGVDQVRRAVERVLARTAASGA